MEIEPYLAHELAVLSREYSYFRSSNNKWKYFQQETNANDSKTLELCEFNSQQIAVLQKPRSGMTIGYPTHSIQKRTFIKRSSTLFHPIHKFWRLLNPNNLLGISKQVYKAVYELLYSKSQSSDSEISTVKESTKNDMFIDFSGRQFLPFADFYDGFFAFLDNFTKSTLRNEYYRYVCTAFTQVAESKMFTMLERFSRLHLTSPAKPQLAN